MPYWQKRNSCLPSKISGAPAKLILLSSVSSALETSSMQSSKRLPYAATNTRCLDINLDWESPAGVCFLLWKQHWGSEERVEITRAGLRRRPVEQFPGVSVFKGMLDKHNWFPSFFDNKILTLFLTAIYLIWAMNHDVWTNLASHSLWKILSYLASFTATGDNLTQFCKIV